MKEKKEKQEKKYKVITYDEVETKEITWLYYPYIALGKIVILQGRPGIGKSSVTCDFAKTVSIGGKFPFSDNVTNVGKVVLQNGEDSIADTIKPRLEKMGANLKNVVFVEEEKKAFTISYNGVKEILEEHRPSLLILDPLQRYIGNVQLNDMIKVRHALSPMVKLAEDYNCAIMFVTHMKKGDDIGIYKTVGSVDIGAIARSVLTVGEYKGEKILTHTKSNVGKYGDSLAFKITNNGIEWLGKRNHISTDNIVNSVRDSSIEEAIVFLKEILQESPQKASYILEKATELDISKRTLDRAKSEIGITSKQKNKDKKEWYWLTKEQLENWE